ncbi:MAG TPA: hypothetical protein DIU07_11980 [Rhodobacteraceae bacterium]|nr:hypothetical protein [Paracoccaceae bacterium]
MKALLPVMFTLLPGIALAHAGHLAEVAGHDHVIAGVAIGVAVGVAIWGVLKGRKDDATEDEPDEAAPEEDVQEA